MVDFANNGLTSSADSVNLKLKLYLLGGSHEAHFAARFPARGRAGPGPGAERPANDPDPPGQARSHGEVAIIQGDDRCLSRDAGPFYRKTGT